MKLEKSGFWKDLTEEQKAGLVALRKSARNNALKLGAKFVGLFFGSVVFVGVLSAALGNPPGFGFAGGALNGIFISRFLISSLKKEHDRISKEVQKILKV